MSNHVNVTLTLTLNHTVSRARLKTYIREALETWQGQCYPGDIHATDELWRKPDEMWKAVKTVHRLRLSS